MTRFATFLRRLAPLLGAGAAILTAAPLAAQSLPLSYVCYRAPRAPRLDGSLDDAAWQAAPWSPAFVDIEGSAKPAPRFRTRMKKLWDDRYLYVAGELQEPDVWGTITQRDAVIFHDNDFEMFIDPDGDALNYVELEINALNTVWDLFLAQPYRDGGHADNSFDIAGLKTGVRVLGTLNHPGDVDSAWTVTIAIPWRSLQRASGTTSAPHPGQRWRINYSRVEWHTTIADGAYPKVPGLREDNWVWSPQGVVDMHQPEHWGYVEFASVRADRRPASAEPATPAPAPPAAAPAPPLVLSGYLADVSGATMAYHSPHPEAETALLARARRDVRSVAWRTDTVPASLAADTVSFVWIAGLAGSKGLHDFDFAIDGRHAFTFSSIKDSASRDWTVSGAGGASLSFHTTLVDQFSDVFGYLTLRLPRAAVSPTRTSTGSCATRGRAARRWRKVMNQSLLSASAPVTDSSRGRPGDTAARGSRSVR